VAGKEFGQLRAVVAGAGVAVTKMLLRANQINNSLAFPGVFRAALDVRATTITENMKLAAADALAALVGEHATADYVIPGQFDERVAPAVTAAVAAAARADGVTRR
jgi:malate dehydrogenase (oxaloacetate-decarboxylating)